MRFVVAFSSALVSAHALADDRCSTVSDCAQKAMEASYQAKLALQLAMPKGAVLPFNLTKCPDGWVEFPIAAGRTIVGAGGKDNVDMNGKALTDRNVGKVGGEEQHVITRDELPNFRLSLEHAARAILVPCRDSGCNQAGGIVTPTRPPQDSTVSDLIEPLGQGKSGNNMPPYTTLLYCTRQ